MASLRPTLLLAAAAVLANAGLIWGGFSLIGNAYVADLSTNIVTAQAVVGVVFLLFGLCLGPITLVLTALSAFINRSGSNLVRFGVPLLALIGCIVAVAVAAAVQFQIPNSFQTNPGPDNLRQTLGGLVFIIFGVLALALVAAFFHQFKAARATDDKPAVDDACQPNGLRQNWKSVAFVFGLYVLLTWLTSFMSPVWNYSSKSYWPATSQWSLLPATATWTVSSAPPPNVPGETWEPAVIVFKLYLDVVVYMGTVVGVAAIALLAAQSSSARRFLHRRLGGFFLSKRFIGSKWFGWSSGVTIGEALVVSAFIGLNLFWAWYWGSYYTRIKQEAASMMDVNASMQTAARVLGHFTTLFMSFTVIPATRNSPLLEGCFGIPFERSLKYHRAMGRLSWLCVTLHMLVWQAKWAKEGTLANNVVAYNSLLIANSGALDPDNAGDHEHADNFTIPIAELGWLVLTVAVVLANFSRRLNYEVFQYAHYGVWFFMLAAVMHAWSHWYFIAGGLTLYAVDKAVRLVNASKKATVKSVVYIPAANVTRLEVTSKHAFPGGGLHYAGQYAFVNVPAVSAFQWHPFTISSAPGHRCPSNGNKGSEEVTAVFHIRAMPPQMGLLAGNGKETWTAALGRVAKSLPAGEELLVSLDGPYGRTGHYYERETVLMVAAGIGFTPFHSVIADLFERGKRRVSSGGASSSDVMVRRVHLVWSARELALFHLFADTLAAVLAPSAFAESGIRFSASLHLTSGRSAADSAVVSDLPTKRSKSTASSAGVSAGDIEIGAPLLGASVNSGSAASYSLAALEASADGSAATPVSLGLCKPESVSFLSGLIAHGRPDLASEFSRMAAESAGKAFNVRPSDRLTAMVCGPESVIEQASLLAGSHGMDFHSEVFHF